MSPRKKPSPKRTASDIAADLWRLRDEADALAHATVAKVVEAQPESVQEALRELTEMLYHKQTHKWEGMIQRTIAALSPEVAKVLDERGEHAAYKVAHGEDE
jgi:hypothetical protein